MDSVELSCPGRIDTHHLIQLESCRPSLSPPIPIPLAASLIVTRLLPCCQEDMLRQHPYQSLVGIFEEYTLKIEAGDVLQLKGGR